jgi:hypothetical protein
MHWAGQTRSVVHHNLQVMRDATVPVPRPRLYMHRRSISSAGTKIPRTFLHVLYVRTGVNPPEGAFFLGERHYRPVPWIELAN